MKSFFMQILDVTFNSRHDRVNHEIAHQLWSSEYKHESFDYILMMVQMGKIEQIGAMIIK